MYKMLEEEIIMNSVKSEMHLFIICGKQTYRFLKVGHKI